MPVKQRRIVQGAGVAQHRGDVRERAKSPHPIDEESLEVAKMAVGLLSKTRLFNRYEDHARIPQRKLIAGNIRHYQHQHRRR